MKKLELNERLTHHKAIEIENVINGLRIPEIMAILGEVIFEVAAHTKNEKDLDITPLIKEWFESLVKYMENNEDAVKNWVIYQLTKNGCKAS